MDNKLVGNVSWAGPGWEDSGVPGKVGLGTFSGPQSIHLIRPKKARPRLGLVGR